jgi:hypothetical protein
MGRNTALAFLSMALTLPGCAGIDGDLPVTSLDHEPLFGTAPARSGDGLWPDKAPAPAFDPTGGAEADSPASVWTNALVRDRAGKAVGRLGWEQTERVQRIAPSEDPALGLWGVDLGVGIVAEGRLHFLFGDAWSEPDLWDRDPVATLVRSGPEGVALAWHRDPTGRFAPMGFDRPIDTGAFAVPVDGLPLRDTTYVFYATDFDPVSHRHGSSVLAHTQRPLDFSSLEVDHVVPSEHFINISIVRIGADVWLFGSGAYRASSVYLARAAADTLEDRGSWEYFTGITEEGEPRFERGDEEAAAPLIDSRCVGELSVRCDLGRQRFLMTYNCASEGEPRGVHLRAAETPWGPWSEPVVVFDPHRDGYGQFMHRAVCGEPEVFGCTDEDDGLSDPGREHEWGGEYGPYLLEPWIESGAGRLTIHYTLSSWNPYAVHLVRTTLLDEDLTDLSQEDIALPSAPRKGS